MLKSKTALVSVLSQIPVTSLVPGETINFYFLGLTGKTVRRSYAEWLMGTQRFQIEYPPAAEKVAAFERSVA